MPRSTVGHPPSPTRRAACDAPMRRLLALTMLTLAAAAPAPAAERPMSSPCQASSPGGDRLDFSCPVDASGVGQRFRFSAYFSGGHDDTMATMVPTLDGAPLACEAGSKTRLMGEDGDVSLACRFTLQGPAGAKHVLDVSVRWSHAEYTHVEFTPE